ncbi:hypothetical protein [uncultured Tenacibaculum sp.]|uniref:hypothetical protein n=1 Tax=uncultured Tenacibaculum sp. TaxID=174713 RepID=UPI00262C8EA1|nr:hypothetical protein [uncultured Tenacibaculum sp.]
MGKSKRIMLIVLVFTGFLMYGQKNFFSKNSDVNFKIYLGSQLSKEGISVPMYRIELLDVHDSIKSINDLNIPKVLKLLDNNNYDWYINILLYHLTGKSAMIYSALEIRTKEVWLEELYEADIKYWKKTLNAILEK